MGLLDGGLADTIFNAFKGRLLVGSLRKSTVPLSGGLNEYGDPVAPSVASYACEGFDENYSDYIRAQAGIPITDVKINIFAKSLSAGIEPETDDQVLMNSKWYQIRNVMRDPATALWTCQSFQIKDPT